MPADPDVEEYNTDLRDQFDRTVMTKQAEQFIDQKYKLNRNKNVIYEDRCHKKSSSQQQVQVYIDPILTTESELDKKQEIRQFYNANRRPSSKLLQELNKKLLPPKWDTSQPTKRAASVNRRSIDYHRTSSSTFDPAIAQEFMKKSHHREKVLKTLKINTKNATLKEFISNFEKQIKTQRK